MEEKDILKREEGSGIQIQLCGKQDGQDICCHRPGDLERSSISVLKASVDLYQAHDAMENTIHPDHTYMKDDYQLQGWMLVDYIGLMLHYSIYNLLSKREILKLYSQWI